MTQQQWNPTVLRNRGVPITVSVLDESGAEKFGPDGEPVTEQRYVRFTLNVLATMEGLWNGKRTFSPRIVTDEGVVLSEGGEEYTAFGPTAWQDFLRVETFQTTRTIFSLMWELPVQTVGKMMIPQEMANYAGALMTAYAISEGVDPTVAMEAIETRKNVAVAAAADRSSRLLMESSREESSVS